MTSMDQAVEFFESFARREHEAEIAFFGERDPERLREVLAAYNRDLFEPPMHGRAVRPPVDDGFFDRSEASIAQRQPRLILRVDRWSGAQAGLFAAHTTSTMAGDTRLFSRYFARETPRGLRLVSRYDVCGECRGTGDLDGRVCPQCRGTGWEFFDGVEVGPLEAPAETRTLREGEP